MRFRWATWILGLAALPASGAEPPVSFRKQIAPLLVANCLGCHDAKKAEGGLNMATFALLRKGGKGAGPLVLQPGKADESELVLSVRADASPRMPYKLPPLPDEAIKLLERWVNEGAKFDGPSESETPTAALVDPFQNLPAVAVKGSPRTPITSVAFRPDGALLAAASGREVLLYDLPEGKERARLTDHPGPLNVVAFTPDGKALVAAGGRAGLFGSLVVWDVATGKKTGEARGHADAVATAAFAPDGATLATAGFDRRVLLWTFPALQVRATLKDHTDAVLALAYSPDGSVLASAGSDRTVKLWNTATNQKLKTLSDARAEVDAVAFAPDGRTLFAAGFDRMARAWEVAGPDAPPFRTTFAHEGAVLNLAASAPAGLLASGGEDRAVKLWDLKTGALQTALPPQADWPQALAFGPDGKTLAVGRHDGTLTLFTMATAKPLKELRTNAAPPPPPPAPPRLARDATLNPPSPRGGLRGGTVRVTLTGEAVGLAVAVLFPESGLTAKTIPADKPDPNRLDLDLTIAPDARIGLHAFFVRTPEGTPAPQTFAVEAAPALAEKEPNDPPAPATDAPFPATIVGAIDRPGDVDAFRLPVKAGQHLLFQVVARPFASLLEPVLALEAPPGVALASRTTALPGRDRVLGATALHDGVVTLRITDRDQGGSPRHSYRIAAGTGSAVTSAFPLGITAGTRGPVTVRGVNLPDDAPPLTVDAAVRAPGDLIPVGDGVSVVAAAGPQGREAEPNNAPAEANPLPVPGGASGRADRPGDSDLYRFTAKKGQRLILETYARRLGSPFDPSLEVLDLEGRPVPRALLVPVAETEVAFRGHNATVPGIRLTRWDGFAVNDVVLIGREVTRIFALPRNPDDDCLFSAFAGQRVGWLETTPEHHTMGQAVYKVEVKPPGTVVPPGSLEPVTLDYRNDDGGPTFDKDARITFDPPADGDYLLRVEDARGLESSASGYHVVARPARPDFRIALATENPNVPRGGTALVTAVVTRLDGFEGPVDLEVVGTPPGVTATPSRIEADTTSAVLAFSASPTAPAYSPPTFRVLGRATVAPGVEMRHEIDPGGPAAGWVTVTPAPNLKVAGEPARVVLHPGAQATLKFRVDRAPGASGRVPIDVKNLPQGVRVLNIGLNGVLVRENETERTVTLEADPWVRPVERPFYASAKAEAVGTEDASPPLWLSVTPAPGPSATRTAGARP